MRIPTYRTIVAAISALAASMTISGCAVINVATGRVGQPLTLSGRIIDQYGNPVPDATVTITHRWPGLNRLPLPNFAGDPGEHEVVWVTSDVKGEFHYSVLMGSGLVVEAIRKKGYEFGPNTHISASAPPPQPASSGDQPAPVPSPRPSPRTVHAWKINDSSEIVEARHSVEFVPDGEFVTLPIGGSYKPAADSLKNVQVAVSLTPPADRPDLFGFVVTIKVADGGIREHDYSDDYPYVAPETGYSSEWTKEYKNYYSTRGSRFYLKMGLPASKVGWWDRERCGFAPGDARALTHYFEAEIEVRVHVKYHYDHGKAVAYANIDSTRNLSCGRGVRGSERNWARRDELSSRISGLEWIENRHRELQNLPFRGAE